MCVKIFPRDLNPGPCPQNPTSIYTCRVTNAPRVCGGNRRLILIPSWNRTLLKTSNRTWTWTLWALLLNSSKTKIRPNGLLAQPISEKKKENYENAQHLKLIKSLRILLYVFNGCCHSPPIINARVKCKNTLWTLDPK